jgi:tetratricopeptide (TPR) repeat protein
LLGNNREQAGDAHALIAEGLAVAQRAGLELPAISISRALGWSYLFDGQLALARRTLDWTVDELERRGEREKLSDIYCGSRYMRDVGTFFSDDLAGAFRDATETYELAVRASNRTVQNRAADALAHIHLTRAEYHEAKHWADRSLELARAIENEWRFPGTAAVALAARVELGEMAATGRYVEMIQRGLAVPNSHLSPQIGVIVDALLAVGDLKRAERAAELAHAHAVGRLREMLSAVALGGVMTRLGREHWDRAERCYEQAIGMAEAIGSRATLAAALIGAADLHAARADSNGSPSQLERALVICGELGLGREQARAERLLARLRAASQRTA